MSTPTVIRKNSEIRLNSLSDNISTASEKYIALHLNKTDEKPINNTTLVKLLRDMPEEFVVNLFKCSFLFLSSGSLIVVLYGEDLKYLDTQVKLIQSALAKYFDSYKQYNLNIKEDKSSFIEFCQNQYDKAIEDEKNKVDTTELKEILDVNLYKRSDREKQKILIVEDSEATATIISNLVFGKYDTIIADTGEQAVSSYGEIVPDIVFLDIGLPDIDGISVLNSITSVDKNSHVIMLTASSTYENIEKALALGAKGFISKPVTHKKLYDFLDKFPQQSEC